MPGICMRIYGFQGNNDNINHINTYPMINKFFYQVALLNLLENDSNEALPSA